MIDPEPSTVSTALLGAGRRPGDATAKVGRVMAANYHPDSLTIEAITALQREVDEELRKEGHPVPPAESVRTCMPPSRRTGSTSAGSHIEPDTPSARSRAAAAGPAADRRRRAGREKATPNTTRRRRRI